VALRQRVTSWLIDQAFVGIHSAELESRRVWVVYEYDMRLLSLCYVSTSKLFFQDTHIVFCCRVFRCVWTPKSLFGSNKMSFITVFTYLAILSTTGWAQYVLQDDYMSGGSFFDKFSFFNSTDPTNGFVDYVEQDYASSKGLISSSSGQVYMGVDHTGVASSTGRESVRITSNKSYNSGLVIVDLEHMPGGICGTWPAFWMTGPDWPSHGEIDILEGVNDQSTNAMTLHTGPSCSISQGDMTGSISTANCDVNAAGQDKNAGCSIHTDSTQSYGTGFNANKGGVYATEWTTSSIKIFFFPRGSIPADITSGSPEPSGWGKPTAIFGGGCDIASSFSELQIVFDTTFCGDVSVSPSYVFDKCKY
jgi:hypothetical protein